MSIINTHVIFLTFLEVMSPVIWLICLSWYCCLVFMVSTTFLMLPFWSPISLIFLSTFSCIPPILSLISPIFSLILSSHAPTTWWIRRLKSICESLRVISAATRCSTKSILEARSCSKRLNRSWKVCEWLFESKRSYSWKVVVLFMLNSVCWCIVVVKVWWSKTSKNSWCWLSILL